MGGLKAVIWRLSRTECRSAGRANADAVGRIEQAGGHSIDRKGGCAGMEIAGEMDFDAASQIEAAFDGRVDRGDGFEGGHGVTLASERVRM